MFCSSCGAVNADGAVFCSKCGAALARTPASSIPAPVPPLRLLPRRRGYRREEGTHG
ncbi:MAG: zinc ribbon domain-containing protein [Nitrososphaerota archaeon]|nr:zinc ribbon domain-containing protein [Nitrososphaerota archaeon]